MKYFFLGGIYALLLLFQMTFAKLISVYGIQPDFILIFVVCVSLKYGRLWGSITGFLAGIIEDSFLAVLFGLQTFCKTIIGFLVSVLPWRITGTISTDGMVLLFFASLLHDFLFNWIYSFGSDVDMLFILLRYALPGAVYTTLIGMITYSIFPAIFHLRYE